MKATAELDVEARRWGEFVTAGDAKGLAAMYAEDCKVFAPGVPPLNGREAFQKHMEGFIASGCTGAKLTPDEVQPGADDIAAAEGGTFWEKGRFWFYKEGGVLDAGKYLAVWKRVSGKIEVYMDIWNSDSQ